MTATSVNVFVVVEDEPDMRLLVRMMLTRDPRLEVVGEAASAHEALELLESVEPCLIVLDHSIEGDIMGLQAAPLLRAKAPSAKILLFTAHDMQAEAHAEPAVDAFLRKDRITDLLPTCLRLLGMDRAREAAGAPRSGSTESEAQRDASHRRGPPPNLHDPPSGVQEAMGGELPDQ